jgi:uncharacterized protein (TIGR02231 family)
MKPLFHVTICAFFIFFGTQIAFAQSEKTIKTSVQRATVYLQGAQLSATETVSIGVGSTKLIFENVSPSLDPNSIQVNGKGGDFVITEIKYGIKYDDGSKPKPVEGAGNEVKRDPKREQYERELKAAQDSLVEENYVQRGIKQQMANFTAERTVLVSNKLMRGEYQRDSLNLLMRSLDYLRTRLANIDSESLKLDKELYKSQLISTKLNTRIATLNQIIAGNYKPETTVAPKPIPQITVMIQSDMATLATLNLSYFVAAAGWSPSYELRASKEGSNVDLRHKASLHQNTGLLWKDVALTLSTGNPSQSPIKPTLSPFYLQYFNPVAFNNTYNGATTNVYNKQALNKPSATKITESRVQTDNVSAQDDEKDQAPPQTAADYVQINDGLTRIEYEIKLKYTIESDNQAHNVSIQNKTIPAQFVYNIVPKMDLDAFLMARITGWDDMNLIPGPARIYFDGSYVGETNINPNSVNDTMQVSLGRDKSIVVTRTKMKDKSKEKILSDNKLVTRLYEINVRNTKMNSVRIIIEDQIPVSQNTEIKVEKLDDDNAQYSPTTGKLKWDVTVRGRDTKKIQFGFEVTYPKDKPMGGF